MDFNKKMPVWAMIALDLMLVAAIIFPFAIFHHVGTMKGWWGIEQGEKINTEVTPGEVAAQDDYFLKEGDPVSIDGDEAVRAYTGQEGLKFKAENSGRFVSLYRSKDVCTALIKVTGKLDGDYAEYYIYDVYVRSVRNLYTVNGRQRPMRELIAEGEEYAGGTMIAAVNGDYSSNKNHCRVVVRNGLLYRSPEVIDSDVCVMFYDGTMKTYASGEFDFEEVRRQNPYQIWDFGPELLDKNGRAYKEFDETAYDTHILSKKHPRTAIGCFEPGHYCFVIVDGRQENESGTYMKGVRIAALAEIMESLGCKCAYNMDGGDSTQAYMTGKDVRIDHTRDPQRVLSDIICVGEIRNGDDTDASGVGEGA